MIESFGRPLRKVRVSLLDACNFRCFYCMPQNPIFLPTSELLSPKEIVSICRQLVDLGITQLRITGGEPTLRREFISIVQELSQLPLEKLGLTTNGHDLVRFLPELLETKLRAINISLDSLDPKKFEQITQHQSFEQVKESILTAAKLGFDVKVNVVVFRGLNDNELDDFVDFSAEHRVCVRFLELMPIGPHKESFKKLFVSADEMIGRIRETTTLMKKQVDYDSTSFDFITTHGAHIGFIASESKAFCASCSRLRLSAKGVLRACLMSEDGLSLRGLEGDSFEEAVKQVAVMKPLGRIESISQPMNQIGG